MDALDQAAERFDLLEQPAEPAVDPSGDAPTEPDHTETAELLHGMIFGPLPVLLPDWQLTDEGMRLVAQSWARVLDKWWPEGFGGRWKDEIAALAITVSVIVIPNRDKLLGAGEAPADAPDPDDGGGDIPDGSTWASGE